MAIDLMNLEPNKVSKDLSSYSTLLFGDPKIGKSRLAAEFPKPLFIATEPTQTTIPGAYIQPATTWGEVKQIVRQLKNPQLKEKFKTVIIDVIDLAASYCEKYICNQNGVEKIGDIPWGAGYKMAETEFRDTLYTIRNESYGLVMISHVTNGTFKREDGTEFNERTPSIPGSKLKAVAENLADIYAFAHMVADEDGEGYHRVLSLRASDPSTPIGSHFPYLPDEIPLSYSALESALEEAIQKEEEELGKEFFQEERKEAVKAPEYDFEELMSEFKNMVVKVQKAVGKEAFREDWAPKVTAITEKYLGKGRKVNDCTADQVEQVFLIVEDLKEEIGNGL